MTPQAAQDGLLLWMAGWHLDAPAPLFSTENVFYVLFESCKMTLRIRERRPLNRPQPNTSRTQCSASPIPKRENRRMDRRKQAETHPCDPMTVVADQFPCLLCLSSPKPSSAAGDRCSTVRGWPGGGALWDPASPQLPNAAAAMLLRLPP